MYVYVSVCVCDLLSVLDILSIQCVIRGFSVENSKKNLRLLQNRHKSYVEWSERKAERKEIFEIHSFNSISSRKNYFFKHKQSVKRFTGTKKHNAKAQAKERC